jgi:hypothetical protein
VKNGNATQQWVAFFFCLRSRIFSKEKKKKKKANFKVIE